MLRSNIAQLLNDLKKKTFSATEVFLESTKNAELKKDLNAYICLTKDLGLSQATDAEVQIQKGNWDRKLLGVPIAIKDNFCLKNYPTTCGSKMLKNFVPKYDSTVVKKLTDAGATIVGKTNLDEFAMGSGTTDSIFGPTKNIWKSNHVKNTEKGVVEHISGGSSGGSAVAVASFTCFGAIGSDSGGSTRNPASYCGVVGYKPTYGLVSRYGLIPLVNSMDVPGILTRSIDDAVQILNCIAGHDIYDSTTSRKQFSQIILNKDISVKGLRIGVPAEYYSDGLSEDVKNVWSDCADILENNGAILKKVSMPHTKYSIVCYSILNQCEVASNMAKYDGLEFGFRAPNIDASTEQLYAETRAAGFNLVVRSRILAGNYFLLNRNYEKYVAKAMKIRRLIADDFKRVWNDEKIDILLTPTTLTDAPKYLSFITSDNREQCATQDYCTQPANMSGCPAVSIPIRLSKRGLPLSIQLMAPNFNDHSLLQCAKFIEYFVEFDKYRQFIKV